MFESSAADHAIERSEGRDGMMRIPGGTFRIGSDKHYPEEAARHPQPVDTSMSHVGFRCVARDCGK
jgi:formylglycine-generating enzyme required for sulfatase activity